MKRERGRRVKCGHRERDRDKREEKKNNEIDL